MPTAEQKIVKVGDDVIAFPGDLEDTHVAKLIKSFRDEKRNKPKPDAFSGKTTGETEHARQLKPAQPLSSAFPSLPDWANKQLLNDKDLAETPKGQAITAKSQKEFETAHPKITAAINKGNNPLVLGTLKGTNEFIKGMTSPANAALMLAAPESKILSGIFAAQAMKGSFRDAQSAKTAFEAGHNEEAMNYVTQALLGAGIAGLAGTHAYKGLPEGVRTKLGSEEGSVPITPAKPDSKLESEEGYAYHATNLDRLHDIANTGKLNIYGPSYGTNQSMWPDRSTKKRAYFTPKAGSAWQFAPEEGTPAIVRTKSEGLKKEGHTGDLYSEAAIGSHNLEYLGADKQWHPIQKLATPEAGNRTYYRGQNPESTEKIKTGDDFWDSLLFVADDPKHAQNYGRNIDKVQLKPDAHILREGTPEFKRVVGPYRPGENMLQFSSRAAQIAKKAGYDAVHFQLQGTVGTAILNREAIESRAPHNYAPTPELNQVKSQAEAIQNGTAPQPVDRRANTELRKRIDEMTPEEMRKILKTSDVVDLPNKRSFLEDQHFSPMPFVARSDADGLKAFNDKFGYEKGDELLKAKAEALKEAGLNAYHEKGDEFLYRGKSDKELQGRLEKAREILRNKVFDVTLDDGTHVQLKGVDFSYGTGKDLKEAETRQHAHKAEREAAGQRKRGELVGLTEVGPQADSQGKGAAQGSAAAPLAEIKKQAAELKPTTAYQAIDQSQPFYLKSENLINEKMKGPMAAEDIHKMLLSNGVKPEEMQWTGLDEFLKSKGKGKVTPQEVQEHLAGNNLQIKEVQKGDLQHGKELKEPWEIWKASDSGKPVYGVKRDNGLLATEATTGYDSHSLAKFLDQHRDTYSIHEGPVPQAEPPKFGSYTLPGGTNYQELLLTMPPKLKEALPIEFKETERFKGEPVYRAEVKGGEAIISHNPGFPWRVDLPNGEADGGFSTAEAAMAAIKNNPRYKFTVPEGKVFQSSHWSEPNVLGHIRMNDRTGPNGEKILHIEELQSDWAQKGRKQGFQGNIEIGDDGLPKGWRLESPPSNPDPKWGKIDTEYRVYDQSNRLRASGDTQDEVVKDAVKYANQGAVPAMPFSKTWPELMLKRMIQYAAMHGYDGISWTPGEQQAERYDLSKQVKELFYYPDTQRLIAYDHAGTRIMNDVIPPDKLPDTIGKEAAQKLLEAPPLVNRSAEETADKIKDLETRRSRLPLQTTPESLEILRKINAEIDRLNKKKGMETEHYLGGVDLKVGGEGMKGFYDKIIPDAANKLGKQWGAKVGETKISLSPKIGPDVSIVDDHGLFVVNDANEPHEQPLAEFDTLEEAKNYVKALGGEKKEVPYLPLKPQAKAVGKSVPYSLFGVAGAAVGLQAVKQKAEELQKQFQKAGLSR